MDNLTTTLESEKVLDSPVILYTYRYMWTLKGSKSVNFKVVTDTLDGLSMFEEALSRVENLDKASYEYLSEFNVSRLGLVVPLFSVASDSEIKEVN